MKLLDHDLNTALKGSLCLFSDVRIFLIVSHHKQKEANLANNNEFPLCSGIFETDINIQ